VYHVTRGWRVGIKGSFRSERTYRIGNARDSRSMVGRVRGGDLRAKAEMMVKPAIALMEYDSNIPGNENTIER
jgi:hypothetical protein